MLWEFGLRTRGVTPSLNDYAHMRQHSAGGVGALSWTEIIDGAEIPGVCGRPHRAAP